MHVNSSPPGQNGRHFSDDIFKCIFMNKKFCILIQISLKFGPKGSIGSGNGLVPTRQQAIIWTNVDPVHWGIYAFLEGDKWTHLPLVPHICSNELDSISSCNGLSLIQHQAITWTNVDLSSFGPLGTKFREIQIKIQDFSFMKMRLKMSLVKWWPFCLGEMS